MEKLVYFNKFYLDKEKDIIVNLYKSKNDELEDSNLDPEELEERARQAYLKDKMNRKKAIKLE